MKNSLLLIVFLALFNISYAQNCCKDNCAELKHGIQFQVTNILNLTNYGGYTLAYRYQITKNSGLRIGLYTAIYKDEYDISQQIDSIFNKPLIDGDNFNIKFSIQYLHRILNYRDFDLLVGGGPFFSINNTESHQEYLYREMISKYYYKNEVTSFGIDLLLGVEYRLASNVVLSGEYGLIVSSESADVEDREVSKYETYEQIRSQSGTRERFFIKGSNVSLGLTIFF
jgi:Outer membrane protein beta-barrel domain